MPTVEILGDIYEFRRVTRKEIRDIEALANDDVLAFEDAIVVACATRLPPTFPGWDDCLAGIP
jgi:predicted nucleic acid-binding protein